jgi:two-component system osmolarity sensor histidine kinase EnvZ
MTGLLEDVLAVVRGEFASAQRERIDLRAPLSGIVEDRLLTRTGLRAELGNVPLWVKADPMALRRLFGDLIDNALNSASHCVVRQRQAGEAIVFIDDDSPGIPDDAHASVLQGRESVSSEWSAGVRFSAHSGFRLDIPRGSKKCS